MALRFEGTYSGRCMKYITRRDGSFVRRGRGQIYIASTRHSCRGLIIEWERKGRKASAQNQGSKSGCVNFIPASIPQLEQNKKQRSGNSPI